MHSLIFRKWLKVLRKNSIFSKYSHIMELVALK